MGANDQRVDDAGTTVETVMAAGEARSFRLHLPTRKVDGGLAIVFCFHGRTDNAARIEHWSGFSMLADREGFIAVFPEGLEAKWRITSNDADVVFVMEVLALLAGKFAVDPDRIYAAGISNGAQMAWRLACERPQAFAACGLVAGAYPRVCGAGDRLPLILFHGTLDLVLPYGGGKGFMSVRDFAVGWATRAGVRPSGRGEIIHRAGEALGERWCCTPGGEVDLYTLHGSGHSWPGSDMPARITSQDVNASELMWGFFKAHPRRTQ